MFRTHMDVFHESARSSRDCRQNDDVLSHIAFLFLSQYHNICFPICMMINVR